MTDAEPGWPEGIRAITVENLASLGINDAGELFWNGTRVAVRRRLLLTWWQNIAAFIVVMATVLGGIGGFAQGATAMVDFGCARQAWPGWCGTAAAQAK